MKRLITILSLCLPGMCVFINSPAQDASSKDSLSFKKRIYKVSVITGDSSQRTGYLASLSGSNLYLSPSPIRFGLTRINNPGNVYSYHQLEAITIKRKGSTGRGALQGAVIGLVTGAIAGFIAGDDPKVPVYNNPNDPFGTALNILSNSLRMTAGEKAVTLGIVGAGTGGLIGALIGSLIKKKFIIGKNKQNFHSMKENIMRKLRV